MIIRLLRTAEGLSQTELARQLNISRSYLSQVENGRKEPGLLLLKKLGRILRVPTALLVGDDDSEADSNVMSELRKILSDLLAVRISASHKRGKD